MSSSAASPSDSTRKRPNKFLGCIVRHPRHTHSYVGLPSTREQDLEVTHEQVRRWLTRLPGLPLRFQHDTSFPNMGKVVRSFVDNKGALFVECEFDDSKEAQYLRDMTLAGLTPSLSLYHNYLTDELHEVTVCFDPGRPGSDIEYFAGPKPPAEIAATIKQALASGDVKAASERDTQMDIVGAGNNMLSSMLGPLHAPPAQHVVDPRSSVAAVYGAMGVYQPPPQQQQQQQQQSPQPPQMQQQQQPPLSQQQQQQQQQQQPSFNSLQQPTQQSQQSQRAPGDVDAPMATQERGFGAPVPGGARAIEPRVKGAMAQANTLLNKIQTIGLSPELRDEMMRVLMDYQEVANMSLATLGDAERQVASLAGASLAGRRGHVRADASTPEARASKQTQLALLQRLIKAAQAAHVTASSTGEVPMANSDADAKQWVENETSAPLDPFVVNAVLAGTDAISELRQAFTAEQKARVARDEQSFNSQLSKFKAAQEQALRGFNASSSSSSSADGFQPHAVLPTAQPQAQSSSLTGASNGSNYRHYQTYQPMPDGSSLPGAVMASSEQQGSLRPPPATPLDMFRGCGKQYGSQLPPHYPSNLRLPRASANDE